jgi:hypothetical protein
MGRPPTKPDDPDALVKIRITANTTVTIDGGIQLGHGEQAEVSQALADLLIEKELAEIVSAKKSAKEPDDDV